MENLREMKLTEGWTMVEAFINRQIEASKSRLETCPLEEVEKHRHKMEAYRSVLRYIDDQIEKGLTVVPP